MFNPEEGPLAGNDLAIFKVSDDYIKDKVSSLELWPICLPSNEKVNSGNQRGIHTG